MILDLLREYAIVLKRVSSTSGGEYAGPCPFCGGNDRFRVWPEHKGGRYWCRGCQKTGDEIQLLRDLCDLSYSEACERLGIETRGREFLSDQTNNRQKFSPRRANLPAPLWSEKAAAFVTYAKANLWSDVGSETRSFLF